MNNEIIELNVDQVETVSGGYDDGNWCGTRIPGRIPVPHVGDPVIIIVQTHY